MRFESLRKRPDLLGIYAKERINQVTKLVRTRQLKSLVLYGFAALFGRRVYDWFSSYLVKRYGESLYRRQVGDHRMYVDLTDPGISRILYVYGIHEERPAEIFRQELENIRSSVERPVVVDVGGNIGYYTLIAAAAVGESGTVYSTEPIAHTRRLLEMNVAENGYEDRVDIDEYAIGEMSGRRSFRVVDASNRNRFKREEPTDTDAEDSVTVDVLTLDEFVRQKGVSPATVNAVRMDVEGFEIEVLRGMKQILQGPGPLVLYFEVHPQILTDDELDEFVSVLQDNEFNIVAVENDTVSDRPFRTAPAADNLEEIVEINRPYALIVRK